MHPCQMVGLDTGSVAKKIALTFLLHVLREECWTKDEDSLVIEHIQVNKAPKMS